MVAEAARWEAAYVAKGRKGNSKIRVKYPCFRPSLRAPRALREMAFRRFGASARMAHAPSPACGGIT